MLSVRPKPLPLYIFAEDRKAVRDVTQHCRNGGGCVNDCVIHLATSNMGFGGVGESGMGSYPGKTGFDAFSHTKSILDKKTGWTCLCGISPIGGGCTASFCIFLAIEFCRIPFLPTGE